jgi:heme exporter protein D
MTFNISDIINMHNYDAFVYSSYFISFSLLAINSYLAFKKRRAAQKEILSPTRWPNYKTHTQTLF